VHGEHRAAFLFGITVKTATSTDGSIAINWAASSNATYYKLQEKKNTGGWSALTNHTTSRRYSRTGRADANYTYRVTACNTAGCDNYWRTSNTVKVSSKTVIFIHTDLLGSPIVETNANGAVL